MAIHVCHDADILRIKPSEHAGSAPWAKAKIAVDGREVAMMLLPFAFQAETEPQALYVSSRLCKEPVGDQHVAWLDTVAEVPATLNLIVVHGASTMSS